MSMDEVLRFLYENATVHLATVDEKGFPRVRPFTLLAYSGGRLYFATQRNKDVYKELLGNPNAEFSVASPNAHWLRLRGKVVFISETGNKEAIIAESEIIERFYKSHETEPVEIFYMDEVEGMMSNLKDNIVKKFKL